ncbi:hypothetical protein B0W47_04630 [Komagataeibacter nataicola]|uniref:Uncharacterized protein n=1 Tax=Komagataeibacter nataicola TaxID=265960 RepID=A0A9N7CG76_9PROT|nr:hypothetical protein [Komagataeibacter nataicola]AQU86870.1 hypothetical protein B0W47_04630 [Komagataeibacter nataicola]PYD67887.1 hypothetical protein CDI09_00685 [Komagataeibacter nataicola]WEQ56175.1 hypothetical protein LV564_03470 [Komagataeibacter nataicola]GBR24117.1 hypothetical protein AA0616_2671 [Komagataeibacter nataicola NRIC 0616]
MLVLLLGMVVIVSLSGSGGWGGGLAWHAGLAAACVWLWQWAQGSVGMACLLAGAQAGLVGLLGVQMLHGQAGPRERSGLRLCGGLVCVAVLAQVIVPGMPGGMTARLMGLAGLSAIVCGVWGACIARAPAALCAGLACGLDGVMLLAGLADSPLVMVETLVAVAVLNLVLLRARRSGGMAP